MGSEKVWFLHCVVVFPSILDMKIPLKISVPCHKIAHNPQGSWKSIVDENRNQGGEKKRLLRKDKISSGLDKFFLGKLNLILGLAEILL